MNAGAETLRALRRVELFGLLDDTELRQVAAALQTRSAEIGELIVEEGHEDRAMFVIASGRVRVLSGGVRLGTLSEGEHFGEVALIVGGGRTATVVAETPCELLILEAEAFDRFAEDNPRTAIRLLREIIAGTSSRLARMNETVGLLLRERGLPRRVELEIRVDGKPCACRNGTTPMELLPEEVDGVPVVAALVDGRARALNEPLRGNCSLAPLTTAHWEGQRIYRRSLGLALLEAARRVGLAVRVGPSLGFAQRILLGDNGDPEVPDPERAAELLEDKLREIVEADVPLVRERLSVLEAMDYFKRVGWDEAARLVETTRHTTVPLVSYGEVFVLATGPLMPSTGRLSTFSIVSDEGDLLLVYSMPGPVRPAAEDQERRERRARDSGLPPVDVAIEARDVSRHAVQMTRQQERWLGALGMKSVGDFNRVCIEGEVGQLIRVAEGFHEKSIGAIADLLAERGDEVKLVCIAGPSSSGKTTFIRRLRVQLQVDGINPKGLGLDDYYVDREATPRDASGELDFEALEALQLDLLREHLQGLVAGREVRTPRFDFHSGKSLLGAGARLQLADNDILMLEGIHGLNPRIYEALPASRVFRIFVCPLVQLPMDPLSRVHASDARLLRRIVRDRHGRSKSPAETILRWPAVRDGERKHIFPYQGHADAVFDTSLVYEISVLKVFAERYLLEVPSDHPAQATAERLLALLERWITIYPDHVPPTSILREFMGGSGFAY